MGFGGGAIPQKLMRQDQARRNARRRDPTERGTRWEPEAEVGPLLGAVETAEGLDAQVSAATGADLRSSATGLIVSLAGTLVVGLTWARFPAWAPLLMLTAPLLALLALLAGNVAARVARRAGDDPSAPGHLVATGLAWGGWGVGSALAVAFVVGAPLLIAQLG